MDKNELNNCLVLAIALNAFHVCSHVILAAPHRDLPGIRHLGNCRTGVGIQGCGISPGTDSIDWAVSSHTDVTSLLRGTGLAINFMKHIFMVSYTFKIIFFWNDEKYSKICLGDGCVTLNILLGWPKSPYGFFPYSKRHIFHFHQ